MLPGKYHQIDFVGLDNTADELSYRILAPDTAIGPEGNVLDNLTRADDSYAFMDEGDVTSLSFAYFEADYPARSFALVSEGYYRIKGSTFYVSTWDGSAWQEHASFEPLDYHQDTVAEFDLGAFLPDADGEYKVKVEHRIAPGIYQSAEGNMDVAFLEINGHRYAPVYAVTTSGVDVLPQVIESDDVRWLATSQAVILKFQVVEA
jgi:hypothetical protein